MMIELVAVSMLVQADLGAPPEILREDPYLDCTCEGDEPDGIIEFDGVVRDAELRLAPDRRSVLPEQVTIFTVIASRTNDLEDRVRLRHSTRPSECGLSFEYGKRYSIRAVREDGELRSNFCLDPRRAATRTGRQ